MIWFLQLIRQFFYSLDSVLYNFIPVMYDLIILISRTTILSQSQIKEFADRVQLLLGVFMLFKVSISLITYIINPDDFSDKSKGFGKLWLNIIISLVLLIVTPYIFSLAYDFQAKILEDSTLADLIMGDNDNNVSYIYNAGNKIAFKTMMPFFTPNVAIESLNSCSNLIGVDGKVTQKCFDDLLEVSGSDQETMINNYKSGIDMESFGLMFRVDIARATVKPDNTTEYFLIDYKLGISTVAAVIVLLILSTFCMDVALRSVKLAFLQLISPIPIISYIDPKNGKDGLFKKWYEMCFKTYLSLFIRLISLYFGIYIISETTGMYDTITGARVNNFVVQLFIIIGVLMFVKQLPKILEGFGFKLDGDGKFTLNPFKKFEEQAAGGKQILGAAKGISSAALAGGAAFGTNLIAKKGNVFSAIAGATSAAGRGLIGTIRGEKFGKNFSNSYSGAMKARHDRDDRRELGVNMLDVAEQRIKQTMNISTKNQIQDAQIKRYEEALTAGKNAKTRAEGEVDKKADSIMTAAGVSLGTLRDKAEALKNVDAQRYARDHSTTGHTMTLDEAAKEIAELSSQANAAYFKARKAATNSYIYHAANGSLSTTTAFGGAAGSVFSEEDAIVRENVKQMQSATDKYNLTDTSGTRVVINTSDLSSSIQHLDDAKTSISASDEFRKAHLVADQTQKQK